MTLGVVIPCYRQERFLPRTIAALEEALAGESWRGALVLAAPSAGPLPPLAPNWRVVAPGEAGPPAAGGPGRVEPLTPGAARMRGLGACGGDWVLFADADVEVDGAWVRAALETVARAPGLAGLGGRLEEWFVDGADERPGSPDMYRVGERERSVEYLATLAFYRREALLAAGGYDPRLLSEEDFELGLRLRGLGLELRSLGTRAARHWSAPRPSLGELSRRWRTGLCFGQGQVLRLYLGRRGFGALLRRQALYLATLGLWALGGMALAVSLATRDPRPLAPWLGLAVAIVALMGARKRSARLGLHSLLSWTVNGAGLAVGLFRLRGEAAPMTSREAAC
jgi:hypothetical protein